MLQTASCIRQYTVNNIMLTPEQSCVNHNLFSWHFKVKLLKFCKNNEDYYVK